MAEISPPDSLTGLGGGTKSRNSRILYLQLTNPAAIPIVRHSAMALAARNWIVWLVGVSEPEVQALKIPSHPRVRTINIKQRSSRFGRKLQHLHYALLAIMIALRVRPRWIYVSNHRVSPVGLLLSFVPGTRVIYHEHDSPEPGSFARRYRERQSDKLHRFLGRARVVLAGRADACALPTQERVERFLDETGTAVPVHCVWNCPPIGDIPPAAERESGERFSLVYQGVIAPQRLPMTVIRALLQIENVKLSIIGYETEGSRGYSSELREHVSRLGIQDRLQILGPLPIEDLLRECALHDVGLVFLPDRSEDSNLVRTVGATVKVFDYLASALPVIVPKLPEWQSTFVDPGYAVACDFGQTESIVEVVSRLSQDRELCRRMGDSGRQRILDEWNFETQYKPVMEHLLSSELA